MAENDLEARLATISTGPGVYLLKDTHGKVIYVGKAVNLRSRVRSYVRGGDERTQVRFLVGRLADVETLVTSNEKEALILENTLIKQYRPRYNIRLKDDKSYVSVKVTVNDAWPRVLVTRRIVKDGNRYFGPFHSASAVRDTLDTIRSRPCIEYDIKRCLAPCVLPVDRAAYEEHLRQAMLLLEGRNREVTSVLRSRMEAAAEGERFEDAARLRDQIKAVETTQERQQVADHWGADQDVFGLYREGGAIEVQVLFVRHGTLVGTIAYAFDDWELPDEEVLEAVLTQFYQATTRDVPDEILVPVPLGDAAVRGEYLSERRQAPPRRDGAGERAAGVRAPPGGGVRGGAPGGGAAAQAPPPRSPPAHRVHRHRDLPGWRVGRRGGRVRGRSALEGRLSALPGAFGRRYGRLRVHRRGAGAPVPRGRAPRAAPGSARDRRRCGAARGRARGPGRDRPARSPRHRTREGAGGT